ncbi:hypothetical protein V494_04887 [Pseudogymnoascus sp. VKM F-4513 (FW-928)]|nr:hypothetical protein V494_04887 [Pseudogymnoascus sp. VKM F-4513 (FW-928)]
MKALVSNRIIATRLVNLGLGKSIGPGAHIVDVPKPNISDQEILVKVHVVGLNPTDFKHIDFMAPSNRIIGCDYAGEVVEVGKTAPGGWKQGDRVAGVVHGGMYHDRGSFAEYLKIDGDLAWKIPQGVTDEDATTYGVSAVTAMLALYVHLGLPLPFLEPEASAKPGQSVQAPIVFVYAGSTCAGLFTIQLAKLAGLTVITTASPHSFDLVKAYGADRVFDYRSATAVKDITAAFPGITYAVDCFSEGGSTAFCAKVLQNKGGKVVTLLDQGQSKTLGVEYDMAMLYRVFGREFSYLPPIGPTFPVSLKDHEALSRFYTSLPLLTKDLKPPPIRVLEGGLKSVLEGLDMLRQGKVSGSKLVVKY